MRAWIAAVAVAAMAGSAVAADRVRFLDTDGSNNEDGFIADFESNGFSSGGDFVTFCVEVVETFGYGTRYDWLISTEVRDNGGSGNISLDTTAGRRVAYLYREFHDGGEAAIRALDGSFGAFTDSQTRELLQRYIWDRFAFPGSDNWSNGTFSEAMFNTLTAQADANGAQSGLHGVRVLNVYKEGFAGDDNNGNQDMLIVIPLPGGAALAGVGLFGLAAAGRRRAM